MQCIDTITDALGSKQLEIFVTSVGLRQNVTSHHCHNEFELSLVLSGKGLYRTTSGVFEMQAGDVFLFSTNEPHKISDVFPDGAENALRLLTLKIAPSFLFGIDSVRNDTAYMNIFFKRKSHFQNRIDRENPHNEELRRYIYAIRDECTAKQACYAAVVQGMLVAALTLLLRHYDLADPLPRQELRYLVHIRDATAYIDRHCTEALTLSDILRAAHLNKTTFLASFRAVYNMTTWDYIHIRRVEKALSLLRGTDDGILEIALQCGFNSTAGFHKVFKKVTGITPNAYRQSRAKK